jgi:hypothetical protein
LSKDTGVPVSIDGKVSEIDQNVCKLEVKKSNRAVGSPLGNQRTGNTDVSYDRINNRNKKEKEKEETYHKNKLIGPTSTQQNGNQTVKINVSYIRCKEGTHQMGEQYEKNVRGRPPEGPSPNQNQNPPRVCKFEWAYKPAADQTEEVIGPARHDLESKNRTMEKEVSNNHDIGGTYPGISQGESDPKRPRKGQRKYKIAWACKPGEGNGREKIEFIKCDPTEEIQPAKENVSYDREEKKTHLKESRLGNCNGRGPCSDQKLRREWEIHRARKPDGRFGEGSKRVRKNKNETHLG